MKRLPWYARWATQYGRPLTLFAAIAMAAPGEYQLARMAGWSPWVAWLMPLVISVYAASSAALAASRPKGQRSSAVIGSGFALLLALAAQVVAHLLTSGDVIRTWWLIAITSAIPPAVVAHVLHLAAVPTETRGETRDETPEKGVSQAPLILPPLTGGELGDETPPETREPGALLTTAEVAELYGVKPSTIGTWKNRGKVVPAVTDSTLGNLYDPETLPRLGSVE
jgi:MerR HTH family regulatory protein